MADEQTAEPTQEPKPPELTPEQAEAKEFATRLTELEGLESEQKKEIRFQIYRLEKAFGLKADDLAMWKAANKLGVELVWITGKPWVYRNLSLAEYEHAAEGITNASDLNRKVAAKALLWPMVFKQESDFLRGLAGITATLAEAVLRTSGFEQVVAISL